MSAAAYVSALHMRADEVEAMLHAGARVTVARGLWACEVRVRVPGQPIKYFAYDVLRYMERTGRVRRYRTSAGMHWRLPQSSTTKELSI